MCRRCGRSSAKPYRPGATAASSGFLIAEVERRFPVRIRIGVRQTAWALGSIGSRAGSTRTVAQTGGMTPSGTRCVLNDALSIYFADATLASAFVARWCAGYKVETAGGVFQVREDEPTPRVAPTLHRIP